MKHKSIEELWSVYKAKAVPPDAGECQVSGTRQAFFAGAATMFLVFEAMGHVTEEVAFSILNRYNAEIKAEIKRCEELSKAEARMRPS